MPVEFSCPNCDHPPPDTSMPGISRNFLYLEHSMEIPNSPQIFCSSAGNSVYDDDKTKIEDQIEMESSNDALDNSVTAHHTTATIRDPIVLIEQLIAENNPAGAQLQLLKVVLTVHGERTEELLAEKEAKFLEEKIGRAEDRIGFQRTMEEAETKIGDLTDAFTEQRAEFAKIRADLQDQKKAADMENVSLKKEIVQHRMQRAKIHEQMRALNANFAILQHENNVHREEKKSQAALFMEAKRIAPEQEHALQSYMSSDMFMRNEMAAMETKMMTAKDSYNQILDACQIEIEQKDVLISHGKAEIEMKDTEMIKLTKDIAALQVAAKLNRELATKTEAELLAELKKAKDEVIVQERKEKRKYEEFQECVDTFFEQRGYERVERKKSKQQRRLIPPRIKDEDCGGDTIVVEQVA